MSENSDNTKTAIVLFNLGGPDSLKAVRPFLFNLFNDKNIITLPSFFRYFIAWFISSKREKTAIEIYSKMGGKSTILEETINQADALKLELRDKIKTEFEIFICMRHWHPMSEEVISKLENYKPDEIILVPLYPQFSTTTTNSSSNSWLNKSVSLLEEKSRSSFARSLVSKKLTHRLVSTMILCFFGIAFCPDGFYFIGYFG